MAVGRLNRFSRTRLTSRRRCARRANYLLQGRNLPQPLILVDVFRNAEVARTRRRENFAIARLESRRSPRDKGWLAKVSSWLFVTDTLLRLDGIRFRRDGRSLYEQPSRSRSYERCVRPQKSACAGLVVSATRLEACLLSLSPFFSLALYRNGSMVQRLLFGKS